MNNHLLIKRKNKASIFFFSALAICIILIAYSKMENRQLSEFNTKKNKINKLEIEPLKKYSAAEKEIKDERQYYDIIKNSTSNTSAKELRPQNSYSLNNDIQNLSDETNEEMETEIIQDYDPKQFISMNDPNKDGVISIDEFKGPKYIFYELDSDHDYAISDVEMDLSLDELSAIIESAKYYSQDEETDESLDEKIEKNVSSMYKTLKHSISAMDKDEDGFITLKEFKGPDELFILIDKNEDNFISLDEELGL